MSGEHESAHERERGDDRETARISRRQDDVFQKIIAGLVTSGFLGGGAIMGLAHSSLGDRLEASQRAMGEKVDALGKVTSEKMSELHVDLATMKASRDAEVRRFDDGMGRVAKLEETVRALELRMAKEEKK